MDNLVVHCGVTAALQPSSALAWTRNVTKTENVRLKTRVFHRLLILRIQLSAILMTAAFLVRLTQGSDEISHDTVQPDNENISITMMLNSPSQATPRLFLVDTGCVLGAVKGRRQSPIDISNYSTRDDCEELSFYGYYQNRKKLTLRNTGGTARVESDGSSFVVGGPLNNVYRFSQMHFHWGNSPDNGSEHTVDRRTYPLEVHLVHFNAKYLSQIKALRHPDGLVVVSAFIETVKDPIRDMSEIAEALKDIAKPRAQTELSSQSLEFLRALFADPGNYFYYDGSLTTAPFCENVQWIILRKHIRMWSGYLPHFQSLQSSEGIPIQSNIRGQQERFDRPIVCCQKPETQEPSTSSQDEHSTPEHSTPLQALDPDQGSDQVEQHLPETSVALLPSPQVSDLIPIPELVVPPDTLPDVSYPNVPDQQPPVEEPTLSQVLVGAPQPPLEYEQPVQPAPEDILIQNLDF